MLKRQVKLIRNGRSQAVRIPRELELPGDQATLTKDGDRLILEPVRKRGLLALLAELEPLDEDFAEIEDLPAEPVELSSPSQGGKPLIRADWPFLHFGAINLFWRREHYEAARASLRDFDYEIISLDCRDEDTFRINLSKALRWFELFGYEPWTGNLNALNDAFWRLRFGPSKRLALCIENYDRLVKSAPELAHALLDIVELTARNHLVDGCRLVALIQTHDPGFEAHDLGARSARWNLKEQFRSSRGLDAS